jgi:hypothetical protein
MNAPFPKQEPATDKAFPAMLGQAARWRGECIQQFAELEQLIEGLLRVLHQAPEHGSKVSVGQPIGAAFKHLRELTGGNGPFASKGKAASATLSELAPWFEWRAHLTHGVLSIWRDASDQWLLALAHRPTQEEVVRTYAINWKDACELTKTLSRLGEALSRNAQSLGQAIRD